MRATFAALAVVTLTSPLSGAQSLQDRRDPEIESLARVAVTLPPEFAADVLLQLAASPRVLDRSWKRELLEDAWDRTYLVQEPYRRAAPNAPSDSRAAMLTRGYDTRLDRVSLQTRAVRLMMLLSPATAREWFEWIDFELRTPSCEEPLVPMLDDYYQTLSMLARTSFGGSPLERADALWFLELYSWKATRPTEMLSIVSSVIAYRATPDDAQYLENVLRWIFDHGEYEPRAFATIGPDLVSKIGDLDAANVKAGVRNATLLRGFRRYLASQLSGPRCADSPTERRALDSFNRLVMLRGEPALTPIGASEARPSRMLGTARTDRLWQSPEAMHLRIEAARLFGDGRKPLSPREKSTRDWQTRATAFLQDLDRWGGARGPAERDYLDEKPSLLIGFFEIAPSGPLRARALRDAIAFLRRSAGRQPNAAWFAHVSVLLDLANGSDRDPILDALEGSDEPTMMTYARLRRAQINRRSTE
jgi:hypothetical protein